MKTIEQLQAAVDEIRAVCNKHGVVLLGWFAAEGRDGEIRIEDAAECTQPERLVSNAVYTVNGNLVCGQCVNGIGDVESTPPRVLAPDSVLRALAPAICSPYPGPNEQGR
jgi:hypothetical protein